MLIKTNGREHNKILVYIGYRIIQGASNLYMNPPWVFGWRVGDRRLLSFCI